MLNQNQSHYAEKQEAGKALRGSGLKKYKPGELDSVLYVLTCFLTPITATDIKCFIKCLY